MKLKNEPKRHCFWSKIQFFFPRMTRVLTSSKLQIAFLPIWTFSLCAISFRRNVTDRELSKKERAHAWVPFPIQIEEPIENRCKKIVIKAGNEFYVCGRACDVSNPLQKFQSSPGYLAFFFAFDWLLALEFCLHPSHLSWTVRTALSHRVKKNWTPVILTFHHPPKCEKCIVFCTDRSCCRTTKAKLRAKGRKLCIEIPTNNHLTTTFCCWRRKENSATFSTDYTNLHWHTLEKKLYQHQSEKQNCWKTFFFFNVSFDFRVRASKQAATTYFLRIPNSLFNL